MHSTIEQIAARIGTLKRQNAVLANCLEAYQTGLIRPKEEVLFYVEAVQGVAGGLIRLEIPNEYVGRRFRVILERE